MISEALPEIFRAIGIILALLFAVAILALSMNGLWQAKRRIARSRLRWEYFRTLTSVDRKRL